MYYPRVKKESFNLGLYRGGNWLFILPKFGQDLFLGVHSILVASKIACNPRYPVLVCLYGQFLSDLLPHLDYRPCRSCLNHFCVLPPFLDSSRIMFRLTDAPGGTFPFTPHRNARLYADLGKQCTKVNRYFNSHPSPTSLLTTVNVA